jgi:hypothetical protein
VPQLSAEEGQSYEGYWLIAASGLNIPLRFSNADL